MTGREPGADVPPGVPVCSVCGEPGAEEIVDGHLICPDCLGEMVEAGSRLDEMFDQSNQGDSE